MSDFAHKYPTLARLLASGDVFVCGRTYVGRAPALTVGTREGLVELGSFGDERATERYLKANPDPAQW